MRPATAVRLHGTGLFLLIAVVAACALYAVGSRAVFAWSWPLLICGLILACAATWLAVFNAGRVFYPRRLRVQFPIELALFHWTTSRRLGILDASVLRYLQQARRAARKTLAARLDGVIDRVKSGDRATATVAGELHEILRDLSSDHISRLPLRRYWVLPHEWLGPLSFIVAVVGVVVAPAVPGVKPMSVDGLLQGLVLFALTYEGLRLLQVITFKVHDARSNRAFRTVIISTVSEWSVASRLAQELYFRVGHLVHLLVDPEMTEPIAELHESGTYVFYVDSAGVSDALTAIAQNADLFVLDGGDEPLARVVRAATTLPDSRYLALSRNGTVPHGYRWIEPLAWRADLRGDPEADPHRLSVLPGQSIWKDRPFQLLAIASLVYFQLAGGTWLAILFMLGAVGRRFPNQLGPVRRALVSRSTLRAPGAISVSRRLVPRVLERRLWIVAVLATLPGLFLVHPAFEFGVDRASDLKLVLGAYIGIPACAFLVSGSLIAVKWSIDRNFRILVLRRNTSQYGYGHKRAIMATCGKYGQVISIRDATFDQTDQGYGERRESSLGSWFATFAEIDSMIQPVGILDTWQRRILMELEVSDFVVFDWIDEITENMQWELRSAAERLPAHRMLIVCGPKRHHLTEDAIASCVDTLNGRPHCLVTSRGPDDQFIWSDHDEFEKAFASHLHAALSALVSEPRQRLPRESVGAWPYPVHI